MIRGLSEYLEERDLVKTVPLDALKHTRIGIDLGVWVRAVLAEHPEPLTAAVGGLPLALAEHISQQVEMLRRVQVHPLAIIQGLAPVRSYPPFSQTDKRPAERARAWALYEADDIDAATAAFAQSNSLNPQDLIRTTLKTLRVHRVQYLTAPFLASAQLAYLERHPQGIIHSMYGSEMLLMYDGVERVILSIDPEKKTFSFVSKAAVLSELKCSSDEFLDACILSGFEQCPTFPPLLDGGQGSKVTPPAAVALVKQFRGGQAAVLAFGGGPRGSPYLDSFCRARSLIKFSLILAEDGKVLPLPAAVTRAQTKRGDARHTSGGEQGSSPSQPPVIRLGNGVLASKGGQAVPEIPCDLQEIFFNRLPDDVYSHMARGLVGTQVYHALLSGQCVELEPLEGGALPEYQHFLRHTLLETPQSPRSVSLALAANQLSEFWKARRVTALYWFDPQRAHDVKWASDETQALLTRVSRWNVPGATISQALTEQQYSRIDLLLCLSATANTHGAQATITPRGPGRPQLERKDEVVVNTRFRLLELRGFVNHEHLHTELGRALFFAIKELHMNDPLQEPLYVALELVRAYALHARYFNHGKTVFSGGPSLEAIDGIGANAKEENRHLLLVMRTLSLVPMTLQPQRWDAPLSRELLAFQAFARAMTRSLRSLAESIASHMLLSGAARCKDNELLSGVALSLPFQSEANTGLGIIVKCYTEGLLTYLGKPARDASTEELDEAKTTLVGMLQLNFPEIRDVRMELARGFRFWGALMVAVRLLDKEGQLDKDYVQQFELADQWLQPLTFK